MAQSLAPSPAPQALPGAGQADWIQQPREAPEVIPENKPQAETNRMKKVRYGNKLVVLDDRMSTIRGLQLQILNDFKIFYIKAIYLHYFPFH